MKRFLLTTAFPDLRRTNGANRAVASKLRASVVRWCPSTARCSPAGQRNERNLASDAGAPTAASILRTGVGEGVERNVQPPQPGIQSLAPQDRERALCLVKKGDEQLAEGNISAARLYSESAADGGLAQG